MMTSRENDLLATDADVSSVTTLSVRIGELWAVSGLYTERWSYVIGRCMVTEKQQNKLAQWKAFFDTVRIKSSDLKTE